jgi:His/Glu/Gln/Arg/opine family amino acid ABC transporter permease subunit
VNRRRVLAALGILTSGVILVGVALALYRMYGPGEFAERVARFHRRWGPFYQADKARSTWLFLGRGLLTTLQIAVVSVSLSLVFGIVLGLIRLSTNPLMRMSRLQWLNRVIGMPVTFLVQGIRAAPLFLLVIYTYIVLPKFGVNLSPFWAGVTALTVYTSCVLAEIVRAGILSLSRGQFEAADALGLTYFGKLRFVVLPQALRRMSPALVSQLITLIKDTSLLSFITVVELMRRTTILQQLYFNPIESLFVAGMVYLVVNLALSQVARHLEQPGGPKGKARPAPTIVDRPVLVEEPHY